MKTLSSRLESPKLTVKSPVGGVHDVVYSVGRAASPVETRLNAHMSIGLSPIDVQPPAVVPITLSLVTVLMLPGNAFGPAAMVLFQS